MKLSQIFLPHSSSHMWHSRVYLATSKSCGLLKSKVFTCSKHSNEVSASWNWNWIPPHLKFQRGFGSLNASIDVVCALYHPSSPIFLSIKLHLWRFTLIYPHTKNFGFAPISNTESLCIPNISWNARWKVEINDQVTSCSQFEECPWSCLYMK